MARKPTLSARDYPEGVQKFLFACAFWTIAADEQLKQGEQLWLSEQFGEKKNGAWLQEMSAAEGNRFFQMFNLLAAALTDNDKRRIFPGLEEWLTACAESDGNITTNEKTVIARIRDRISLNVEIARLARTAPPELKKPGPKPAGVSPKSYAVAPSAAPERRDEPSLQVLPVRLLRGHAKAVIALCVNPAGTTAFSGSGDRTIRSWDLSAGVETRAFEEQDDGVVAICCSLDGGSVYSASASGTVMRWNAGSGGRMWRSNPDPQGPVAALGVNADGQNLLVAFESGAIVVCRAGDGHPVKELAKQGTAMHDACFDNGILVAAGGDGHGVKVMDWSAGSLVRSLTGHRDAVTAVCFSPDGRLLASGSMDKSVRLWDVRSWSEMGAFSGHVEAVTSVEFSPDGSLVLSASLDGTVRAWEATGGKQVFGQRLSSEGLSHALFHPGGRDIIAAGLDHCIHLVERVFPG